MNIIIITCIQYKIIGLTNHEVKLASQQITETGCWKGSIILLPVTKALLRLFEPYPALSTYNTELMTLATQWT